MQFNTDNKSYFFNGYITNYPDIIDNINLYTELSNAKISANIKKDPGIGDYLLVSYRITSGSGLDLYKYTKPLFKNNDGFIKLDINRSDGVYYCSGGKIYIITGNIYNEVRNGAYIDSRNDYLNLNIVGNISNGQPGSGIGIDYNKLYLDVTTGKIYRSKETSWIEVITCSPKLYFWYNDGLKNNKYIIYTDFSGTNITIRTLDMINSKYQGYFLYGQILDTSNIEFVKTQLKEIKFGVDAEVGDTMICILSDSKYSICVLDTINTLKTYDIIGTIICF